MPSIAVCPARDQLVALMQGKLPTTAAEPMAAHVESCSSCVAALQDMRSGETMIDFLGSTVSGEAKEIPAWLDGLMAKIGHLTHPTKTGVAGNPASAMSLPERLDGYRIIKLLGQGGMGSVFLAEDERLGRKVALKTMKPELAANATFRERFFREARAAAAIEHDNIVPIYQVSEDAGVPFIAMPFLKGESLDDLLKRINAPLPVAQAVQIAREVAQGLDAAHEVGLIHRDIKPANIWLEANPGRQAGGVTTTSRVKILDFGLARAGSEEIQLTATGVIVGTPAYMAPEQARGRPVDSRADLFSLGCVAYQMLTGRRPFSGADTMGILTSLALDTPTAPHELNPQCPRSLSDLVMQLLAKEPTGRPASAAVVIQSLTQAESPTNAATAVTPAVSASPWADIDVSDETEFLTPPTQPKSKPNKRRPRVWLAVGLSLMVLGLFVTFGGTIYRVATNKGELVIHVDDENIEVKIVQNGVVVRDKTAQREFTLNAGQGEIEVLDKDGLKVMTKKFELTRNGKTTVMVTLPELADARKPKLIANADADRKAAEWVLACGGKIGVGLGANVVEVAAIKDLPAPVRLVYVDLHNCPNVADADLDRFAGLTGLVRVTLDFTAVTDAGLTRLAGLTGLYALGLSGTRVTDAGLAHLRDLPDLKWLGVGARGVTDAGLETLKAMPRLQVAYLNGSRVTDAGTRALAAARPDCKIEWDGGVIEPKSSPDPDRKAAEWVLSLGGALMTNQAEDIIKSAVKLPAGPFQLSLVDLGDRKITDADLARLQDCKNLTYLRLAGTPVSNAGLAHFKECTTLNGLDLAGLAVSDDGLKNFKDCKNLRFIDLSGTQVTDAGLAYFKDCKTLINFKLQKTKVTAAGIDDLKKALPQCKFAWDEGMASQSDPDREVATLLLPYVGTLFVDLNANHKQLAILPGGTLPSEPFVIVGFEFYRPSGPPLPPTFAREIFVPALARLKSLHGIFDNSHRLIIAPEDLDGLSHLPMAQKIEGLGFLSCALTPRTLEILRRFPHNLKGLVMGGEALNDDLLVALAQQFPNLTSLVLDDTSAIGERGQKALVSLPLQRLTLSSAKSFDPAFCRRLASSRTLAFLNAGGSSINDAGVAELVANPDSLREIWLHNTSVSDASIPHLLKCPKMQRLHLYKTKMTAEGVRRLAAALPQCWIEWDGGVIEPRPAVGDPDRKAAEWVLAMGGRGTLRVNDQERPFNGEQGLPDENFVVTNIEFWDNKQATAEGFKNLTGLRSIERLILKDSRAAGKATEMIGSFTSLRYLLLFRTGITDAEFKPLCKISDLNELNLTWASMTDASLGEFEKLTGLSKLWIGYSGMSWRKLAQLKNVKNLESLELFGISDPELVQFKEMPRLTHLGIRESAITGKGLASLKTLPMLTDLNLIDGYVSDTDLDLLAELKQLKHVHIKNTKITADGAKKLGAALPQCKIEWEGGVIDPKSSPDPDRKAAEWVLSIGGGGTLRVNDEVRPFNGENGLPEEKFAVTNIEFWNNKKVTAEGLKNLTGLREIEQLIFQDQSGTAGIACVGKATDIIGSLTTLRYLHLNGTNMTDQEFKPLRKLSNLNRLNLAWTNMTDESLGDLEQLTSLTRLDIGLTKISWPKLAQLKNVKNLEILRILTITDADLVQFKDMPRLTHLAIQESPITGKGLASIKTMPMLTRLWLQDGFVSDADLDQLIPIKQLTEIRIKNTKVTADGIKKLAAARPDCKIEWDGGVIEPKPVVADADRKAAEWVLSVGGKILLLHDQNWREVTALKDFPGGPYELVQVSFENNNQVTDAGLENLKGFAKPLGVALQPYIGDFCRPRTP